MDPEDFRAILACRREISGFRRCEVCFIREMALSAMAVLYAPLAFGTCFRIGYFLVSSYSNGHSTVTQESGKHIRI